MCVRERGCVCVCVCERESVCVFEGLTSHNDNTMVA